MHRENKKLNESILRQEQTIARNEESIRLLKEMIKELTQGKLVKEEKHK